MYHGAHSGPHYDPQRYASLTKGAKRGKVTRVKCKGTYALQERSQWLGGQQ